MANKNFNGPDQTGRLWSTVQMATGYPPGSIQSLPLAPVSKSEDIQWLERLYQLPDFRRENSD